MSSQRDQVTKQPSADEPAAARTSSDTNQNASNTTTSATQRQVAPQQSSKSNSSVTSPRSSRTSSPNRQSSTAPGSALSSPVHRTPPVSSFNRSSSQIPSASAVQKALTSASAESPRVESSADVSSKPQQLRGQGQAKTSTESSGMHWPISPRLKSPPPSGSSRRNSASSTKQSDSDMPESSQPSMPNRTPSLAPSPQTLESQSSEQSIKPSVTHSEKGASTSKVPRGASGITSKLETVDEGDPSTSPNDTSSILSQTVTAPDKASPEMAQHRNVQDLRSRDVASLDSAGDIIAQRSDTEGNKSDSAMLDGASVPTRKRSVPALTPSKVRTTNEGSSKNMTVETETVSSVPQALTNAVAAERIGSGRQESSGSVKSKQSNETIRPRKDKKKAVRKLTTLGSGTSSSKADIFEAKVANALDEGSTDSDETFVYESNPPEARPRQRHHSRTPSATSVQSTADRRGTGRSIVPSDHTRAVTGKRSMKFASNTYSNNNVNINNSMDDEYTDENAPRASNQRNGTRVEPQNSRRNGNGHYGTTSEADSPYSAASKQLTVNQNINSRHSSRANTPRAGSPTHLRTPTKQNEFFAEDADGHRADDESAPLISTALRTPRTRGSRRPLNNLRHVDYYTEQPRSFFSRCAGCVVMLVTIAVVVFCAAGILFATTKPLYDLRILEIQNVLASEQEIMLDLLVQAVNPNIVAVSVSEMDVNIFARSKHVGTDRFWRHHDGASPSPDASIDTRRHKRRRAQQPSSWDRPDFPPPHYPSDPHEPPVDDPESGLQTMLLGRIFHFDSGLTFEAAPIRRTVMTSVGGLRLQQPGNKTETGGTERWERVIQHPFELIVRGVLKYTLPLSGRLLTHSVGKGIILKPDDIGNAKELPRIGMPSFEAEAEANTQVVDSSTRTTSSKVPVTRSLRIRVPIVRMS